MKRVPGTSGLLHKTEDGAWVWSDDDLVEEDDENEPKQSKEVQCCIICYVIKFLFVTLKIINLK